MGKVCVVTISECAPVHENELDIEVFAEEAAAVGWIEE